MKLPSTAVFEITSNCNHKCIFCSCPWEYSVKKPNAELSTDEWQQIMDLYRWHGVTHISFTGGEPTLRKDLPTLVEYARNSGYTVGVITNGRIVYRSLLQFFKVQDVLLSISVPGIDTFFAHTGVDNVQNVLNLFETCREIGLKPVANIAVTKKNFAELYQNVALPLLHGAEYVLLNRFLPGGRGMHNTEFLLSKEEIIGMLDIAEEVLERAGAYGHVGTELPFCLVNDAHKYKRLEVGYGCSAGKDFFVVDPEGYIKVCNHSPQRLCKWNEIDTLQTNAYWQRFANRNYFPQMCNNCPHTYKCDGGCREAAHVYYGQIDDQDPCFECKSAL